MNTFGHYRGRCAGRVLNVINQYVPIHIAESITVGDKKVSLLRGGVKEEVILATYEWEAGTDFPVFTFTEKYKCYQGNQERLIDDVRARANVYSFERKEEWTDVKKRVDGLNLKFQMFFDKEKESELYKSFLKDVKELMAVVNEATKYHC